MSQDMLQLISVVANPILPKLFAIEIVFVLVVMMKTFFQRN